MASGALTAYPGHNAYHGVPLANASTLSRHRFNSDPTLLETDDDTQDGRKRSSSARDSRSYSEENLNLARQARRAKKKKLKRLKSFVHVFLGGIRRRHTIHGEEDVIAMTRFRQRDERDGLASEGLQREGQASTSPSHGELRRPLSHPHLPRLPTHIPGLCGLYNHGNTCFMNAVLQCLSNTDKLAEYFVTDHYKNDLVNQRASKRFGTAGDVTGQLALLLKCLWNGQYDPRVTSIFKEVVGKYANQYQGTSQHDAQEFFLWLLDNVHEDLNQAGKKKYRAIKDSVGRPDEEVAAETLVSHLKSNNSFIQNLFQGQFRSALLCPTCGARSCTFDPYVCISLPLLQRETRPIYVTVVYRNNSRKMQVFGVNVSIDSSVRDLRNHLAELCGINRHHLVLSDLFPDGFHRTFYDDQHISVVHPHDLVFGFECPPYRGDNPEAHTPANPSGSKELILVLVVNKFGQTRYGKRFGPPLILRIWRDLTHSQFQSVVLKAMSRYVREGVRLADVCRSGELFRCRVTDGHPGRCVLPTEADHPFYSPSVDKALSVSMLYGGPAHIKVMAEWDPETKAGIFGVLPDEIPEPHESVPRLRQFYQQPLEASLDECLDIYTQEETLNREDSWFCTHCKQQQSNATKKITLWTLPDVLVIHLKRFRQFGLCRTKLSTLVKFPISGLDMTPYIASPSATRPASAQDFRERIQISRSIRTLPSKSVRFEDESASMKKGGKSRSSRTLFHLPWRKKSKKNKGKSERCASPDTSKPGTYTPSVTDSPVSVRSAPSVIGHSISHQPFRHPNSTPVPPVDFHQSQSSLGDSHLDNIYDLYAVCNHMGSMSRGHYTAYCRNPADGNWYLFDDQHVQPACEEQLITPGAYMLFYVRQNLLSESPLSSSESSASSGGSNNHWVYHIPQFTLDLGSLSEDSVDTQSMDRGSQHATHQYHPRQRLGSVNSAVSAPPTSGARVSPLSSAQDNDSDVFAASVATTASSQGHPRQDARSALSLPPYVPHHVGSKSPTRHPTDSVSPSRVPRRQMSHPTPPSYDQAILASPIRNRVVSGRHPSLRLGRARQTSPSREDESESFRRGRSFHAPKRNVVHRSDTLPGRHAYDEPQQTILPTRSIPDVNTSYYSPTLPHRTVSTEDGFLTQPRQRSASYSNRPQRLTTPTVSRSHHVSHV